MLEFGLASVAAGLLGIGWRVHALGQRPPLPGPPRPAVVLGARVFPDGTPSDALVDRVRVGVALWASGRATALLLTGGTPDARPAEAQVMRALARRLGAPEEVLWLEAESRSTLDNARYSARLLAEKGAASAWLVTCDFHVARATAQFRRAGVDVTAVPSPRRLTLGQRALVTTREVAALLRRPTLLRGLW
jgi:uncharacterized SAM-binding protein YcdF (DUF218 family)